jgi:YrbI family 3-deoxy-D-manno-octulosonate 8-phosphate phosphatase
MTDAGMYYSNSGDELKKFCTLDGMGISLLRQQQIKVAVITGEQTQIVIDRCRKLHVDFLFDHVRSKLEVLQKLAAEQHLSMNQIAYLGDDINDLDCIRAAGIGFCVPDAVFSVREAADVVLRRRGGAGAVREAAEYLLGTNNY